MAAWTAPSHWRTRPAQDGYERVLSDWLHLWLDHLWQPGRTTDAEVDANVGCLKASITALAISVLAMVLIAVGSEYFAPLAAVWVSDDLTPAALVLLASLAVGVVIGVRSEHLHGSGWLKVGASTLLVAFPVYFVLVFLVMFEVSELALVIVAAIVSLPLVLKAASWLRAVRNAPP